MKREHMDDDNGIRIILASNSPRRKELMQAAGIKFDIVPAKIDEDETHIRRPAALVRELAIRKANAPNVLAEAGDDGVVIAADTVVALDGKVFGKPHTYDNAVAMLNALNGRWHTVYTGVCVRRGDLRDIFTVRSKVRFKKMSDEQIRDYIEVSSPFDKAGAYGIQDEQVVKEYRGSYTNIVGLPMEKLERVLRRRSYL